MAEYIERDLLKRAVHASDLENREKMALLACVSSIPAAEVAPVVHAHWNAPLDRRRKGRVCCSECCGVFWVTWDYCPNCGAKMDGAEG